MSPPQHQALAILAKFGEFMQITVDTPRPGPGELLVQVKSVALNPIDWKVQKYGILLDEFPAIIGCDVAGVVVAVGEGVSNFTVGDRVLYQPTWTFKKGGYQEYSLTEADFTAKIPENLSFDEAATLPSSIATAAVGLYLNKPYGAGLTPPWVPSARGKYAGKSLVVLGGASSVGIAAIQFGRLSGFSPIIAIASQKHELFLKSFGATHIIDRYLPLLALAARIAMVTTVPLGYLFDSIGTSKTQQMAYDLLPIGGQLMSVHSAEDGLRKKAGVEFLSVYGDLTLPRSREFGVWFYKHIPALLGDGSFQPHRFEVLPGGLGAISGGLERHGAGQVSAVKLIVHLNESASCDQDDTPKSFLAHDGLSI